MRSLLVVLSLCLALLGAAPALSVNPDEVLADPALELRAREVSKELRCLVCQNQSIDDSNADLARDLRVLVRERITAGDTNDEVLDYVVNRYGEFVLLRPVWGWHTMALWVATPLLFLAGGVLIVLMMRGRSVLPPSVLTDAERVALSDLQKSDTEVDDEGRAAR